MRPARRARHPTARRPHRPDAQRLGEERRDRLRVDADIPPAHPAGLPDLREHVADDVARRGEADAFVAAGLRVDERADADQPAFRIDQRPAAVARIDRRVGLDVDHRIFRRQLPRHGADHAQRHRGLETRAGCRTPARSARGAAPRSRRTAAPAGPVASIFRTATSVSWSTATICAPTTRPRRRRIVPARRRSRRAESSTSIRVARLDDVRVGHDIAVGVDDDARAAAALEHGLARRLIVFVGLRVSGDEDLHDARAHALGEILERLRQLRQAARRRLTRRARLRRGWRRD